MRLTSDVFVSALMRTARTAGLDTMLLRRGAAEAGAVFVVAGDPSGHWVLFSPAPQAMFTASGERQFECRIETRDETDISDHLARETRFDPDAYIIELTGARSAIDTVMAPHLGHPQAD